MGRHTKFDDQATWVSTDTDPSGIAIVPTPEKPARRMAWIGRTPLLPVLAGIAAVGVVAAALSTQQISLNFSNSPGDAACVGCETKEEEAGAAKAPPAPSASKAAGARPVRVGKWSFKSAGAAGFAGAVTVVNTGNRPLAKWRLRFRIPNAVITSAQGVTLKTAGRKGGDVYFVSAAPLAPGKQIVVRFTARGAWSKPGFCKINGLACG